MRDTRAETPRKRLDSDPSSGERTSTRRELSAALAFLEGVREQRMDRAALVSWLREHVPTAPGVPALDTVHDLDVGAAALGPAAADEERLRNVVEAARTRTIAALTGLLEVPARDGFAIAALVRGRVERRSSEGSFGVTLRGTEPLSEMVLGFFAADFLCHREEYEARLRVCGHCGRVDLEGMSRGARRACDSHG